MSKLTDRFANAFNVFFQKDTNNENKLFDYGGYASFNSGGEYTRPDRPVLSLGSERSIIASIITRIGIDTAAIDFRHVQTNANGGYSTDVKSDLNECLITSANLDQTGRAFIQDLVMSMCDEGCVAVVPTVTSKNPDDTEAFNIYELRVGKIIEWYPRYIKINLYNSESGKKEDITLSKENVAIIENPLYHVMNEPNSTMNRLRHKLTLLDKVDETTASDKLNMIIQFPFTIKTETKREEARKRRKELEDQLTDSKYGVGYIDAAERITQLNRSLDNGLLNQINGLISMVYAQLGLTENVFNGTADEKEMLNYYNRTIEPICAAIALEFRRKFLSRTARSQGQTIMYFNNPFKLTTTGDIAEMADKFTRNEILSPNEMRSAIGFKQINDDKSDELRNRNLNQEADAEKPPVTGDTNESEESKDTSILSKRISSI